MPELPGKVAIVTGGLVGIGRAISEAFVSEGANVVIASRNKKKGEKVSEEINSIYGKNKTIYIQTDVTDYNQVSNMVKETIESYKKIDILVNNAGVIHICSLLHLELEDWKRVIDVNLTGSFICCKEVIPYMKKQRWGRIINISSTSGITGGTSGAAYAAAKGGLIAFTKALSNEFAPFGITVNSIAPSKIQTPMLKDSVDEKGKQELIKKIPVGRVGKPEEIAHFAVCLSSGLSGYITGQVIVVSGGYI